MRLLNKTTLIKKLYRRLGIGSFVLPYTDDELFDIMVEDTLPDFSFIYPYYYNLPITDCEKISPVKYKVPSTGIFENSAIIGAARLVIDNQPSNNFNVSGFINTGMGNSMMGDGIDLINSATDEMIDGLRTDLSNFGEIPILLTLEEPNVIVTSRPISQSENLMFKLHLTHPDLNTIPNSQIITFFKIFVLDVKGALYERMKNVTYSASALGDMTFNIDEWASAYEDRDELIESLYESTINEREDNFIRL